MELTDPRYMYADILIALAHADEGVDERERDLLDGMFEQMKLDSSTVEKMWLTPRTLDVVESILRDVQDAKFKNCLIKDCYLLAYADEQVGSEEGRFITQLCAVMAVSSATRDRIHAWVRTALSQRRESEELFGSEE